MTEQLNQLKQALADRYAIERQLGMGGMATVYLAADLRHERKVAVKVLRPELAAILGAERFLKEIRTTAALQHPHILPLHDSGESDGMVYYVMPYVEGESLRDRLNREHQLPVADAIRIAREVASALDYAHRHNVVHRDIKPENILLHEGQALVADFGIALAVSTAGANTRLTETGMSLGTPHYMSPEQAMGEREITARSDVYSLGCVLYEMLSGEPPFTGPTAQAIVARVVTEEPRRLTIQRKTIPPHVEAVVLKALEKLPADRFAAAAQFAEALEKPGMVALPGTAAFPGLGRVSRGWRARIALPLTALAAFVAGMAGWALTHPANPAPLRRYALSFPAGQEPIATSRFALSPDGSILVYTGPRDGGGSQLWIKRHDSWVAAPMGGTAGVANFTLSPDANWLAFVQDGRLKKSPLTGGAAITLADSVGTGFGLAWLDDGTLVYQLQASRQLRRVSEIGDADSILFRSDTGTVLRPSAMPGSRGVLFVRCRIGNCNVSQELWVLDLRSGSARLVEAGAAEGFYAPTGHVVYVRRDGGLFALPFDLDDLEPTGPAVPVYDSIGIAGGSVPLAALSSGGTLVTRRGNAGATTALHRMVWLDRRGNQTPIDTSWTFQLTSFGANIGWSLSPDGSRIAIGLLTGSGDDVWVKQLPAGPLSRVSYDSASEYRPRWMPDGRSVLFGSNRGGTGTGALYRRAWDGTGVDEQVLDLDAGLYEGDVSRDGRWLIARTGGVLNQVGGRNIVGLRIGVDTAPVPLVASAAFDEAAMALSPDSRWLAYESNETGRTEVFLRPFPGTDAAKWQISNNGGMAPLWARNGRELFYVDATRRMVSVAIVPGPNPLGAHQILFRMPDEIYLAERENYTPYDISPDGRRFLMARRVQAETAQAGPVIVTENWFEELRARLRR